MGKRRLSMGQAVDQCIRDTTEEWFRQHKGLRTREEALANDVRMLNATVERRPGGFLKVYVGVVTKDRNTTQMDIRHFRQSGELGYVPTDNPESNG